MQNDLMLITNSHLFAKYVTYYIHNKMLILQNMTFSSKCTYLHSCPVITTLGGAGYIRYQTVLRVYSWFLHSRIIHGGLGIISGARDRISSEPKSPLLISKHFWKVPLLLYQRIKLYLGGREQETAQVVSTIPT